MPVRTSAELKKQNDQPLRVYRDSSDKTGIALCRPCRDTFYTLNPAASGAGEYGGQCEHCPREATGQAATGTHTQASSKAQRVSGHLAAGRDYEQARDLSRAHRHYQAALMLATAAERPAIQEAMDRLSAAPSRQW